jgi:hypothetical protein
MDSGGSVAGGKLTRAWSWPLNLHLVSMTMVKLYIHSSNTPSWCGAQLIKHKDDFTFLQLWLDVFWNVMCQK